MPPARTPAPARTPGAPSSSALPASPLGDIDLDRLDKVMVLVAFIGVVVNLVQLVAISNHAWVQGTALKDGQPFTAYLALDSVTFGVAEDPRRDNAHFCHRRGSCDLSELCQQADDASVYPQTGLRKNTEPAAWCGFEAAGGMVTKLLWSGLFLGLVATGVTGMYALQSIPWVADQFDKIEALGFSDRIQTPLSCLKDFSSPAFAPLTAGHMKFLLPSAVLLSAVPQTACFSAPSHCGAGPELVEWLADKACGKWMSSVSDGFILEGAKVVSKAGDALYLNDQVCADAAAGMCSKKTAAELKLMDSELTDPNYNVDIDDYVASTLPKLVTYCASASARRRLDSEEACIFDADDEYEKGEDCMYVAEHDALPPAFEACLRRRPLEKRQLPALQSLLPDEIE